MMKTTVGDLQFYVISSTDIYYDLPPAIFVSFLPHIEFILYIFAYSSAELNKIMTKKQANLIFSCKILVLITYVESVLLCQCQNNHTINGMYTDSSNCKRACAAKRSELCFVTRTSVGCISWNQCQHHDDLGYKSKKTFMKCCKTNYCNSHINQNTIDDFRNGESNLLNN